MTSQTVLFNKYTSKNTLIVGIYTNNYLRTTKLTNNYKIQMIFDTRLNKIIQFSRFQCEYEENANVCYSFTIEFQIICLLQPINGSNYRSIIMMINRQVLIIYHLSRMLSQLN